MNRSELSPDEVRVLIVDDEPHLRHLLRMVLAQQGWAVDAVGTGAAALARAREWRPHLIVLDIVLPDMDGMQVLRELRRESTEALVLFLTANSAVTDRIAGIAAGGDDYVTKPFSVEEVVVRLRGLLRRSPLRAESPAPLLEVGDLVLNEDSHQVTRAGEDIRLTATEFSLLRFLMDNANIVLGKEQILSRVWDYDFGRESNIVELYISYLRKKIDAGRAPMLHTIRRVGYVLRPAAEIPAEAAHP